MGSSFPRGSGEEGRCWALRAKFLIPDSPMSQVTQWGGLVKWGEPSESLGSVPSGGLIHSGEIILFRKIKLKERKNEREGKKTE